MSNANNSQEAISAGGSDMRRSAANCVASAFLVSSSPMKPALPVKVESVLVRFGSE